MITAIQPQAALARMTARKLQILEVESWFEVLKELAEAQYLWVKLENRYWKSAYVYSQQSGDQLGRIWVNGFGIICYDLKDWRSHYEEVPTLESAINELVDSAIEF